MKDLNQWEEHLLLQNRGGIIMTIKWPPKKAFEYDAKDPERENGIVISAQPGGNPKKRKTEKTEEGR